jgi:outer membrane receptor protein involved in Fe transport
MARLCSAVSLFALLIASGSAWSQEPEGSPPEPKKLEKIEVQGPNEVDQRRESTAAKIVVSHKDLVQYGDTTLLDAMKRLPGVTVEGGGGRGGSILLRGLGAGYTQILVDGQPAPPGFSIETLSPDLVERIEIYRSATAEFSTQAIAGTINIVLRKATRKRSREVKAGASVAHGQASTTATAVLADQAGSLSYTLPFSLNTFRFDAPAVAEQRGWDAAGVPDLDYVTAASNRGSGDTIGVSPKLSWNWGSDHTLTWESFLNRNRFRGEFDERSTTYLGAPPTYGSDTLAYTQERTSFRNSATWARRLANDARIEAHLGFDYNRRSSLAIFDGFDPAETYFLHRTVDSHAADDGLTFKGKYVFPLVAGHAFVAGWDGEHARRTEERLQLDSNPAGAQTFAIDESYDARINRLALFSQDEWEVTPRASLYLGLRWEGIDTRSTGNTFDAVGTRSSVLSPIVQALWKLPGTEKDQLRAGLARTYKPPGTLDIMPRRYIANDNTATTPDTQGNPNLKPELSWGLDLAYEHYFAGGGLFSASAYERRIDDVILHELLETNGTFILRPANEGHASVRGIELEAKFALASLFPSAPAVDVHANVSRHWSTVDFLPGPDNRLEQQKRWSGNLGLDYRMSTQPLTVGGNFTFTAGGPVRLSFTQSAYTSVLRHLDLYGLWKISPTLQLRVYANNLMRQDALRIDRYADSNGSLELSTVTPTYRTVGFTFEVKG